MNPMDIQFIHIVAAVFSSFILFVSIDLIFNLPKSGSTRGVEEISRAIAHHGGDKAGGMMMGNILCSPDASAGVLLAACGVYVAGILGGLIAAAFVFIGCRICHDENWYPSTTGALLATFIITVSTYVGISASAFIVAMVINIMLLQGISHIHASHILGRLWLLRKGKGKEGNK